MRNKVIEREVRNKVIEREVRKQSDREKWEKVIERRAHSLVHVNERVELEEESRLLNPHIALWRCLGAAVVTQLIPPRLGKMSFSHTHTHTQYNFSMSYLEAAGLFALLQERRLVERTVTAQLTHLVVFFVETA